MMTGHPPADPGKEPGKLPPPEDSSSDDDDVGNKWRNSTDPDAHPNRIPFTPQRDPGFQLHRDQNCSPFSLFSLFFTQATV